MNIINEAKNKLETWKCKTKAKMEAYMMAKQTTKDGTSFMILLMSNEKDDVNIGEGTLLKGVNKIIEVTFTCFLATFGDYFLGNILKIFLEFFERVFKKTF